MLDFVRAELPRLGDLPPAHVAYTIDVQAGTRAAEFASTLQSAGFAGRRDSYLTPSGILLHVRVPHADPNHFSFEAGAHWPRRTLLIDVGVREIELWRVSTTSENVEKSERKASIAPSDDEAHVAATLAQECALRDCNPLLVTLDPAAPIDGLLRVFAALTARPEFHGSTTAVAPEALVLLSRHESEPGAFVPQTVRASGRLPAEEIQKIIRARYGDLRVCYERGLARDPALQGRVNLRFVIGVDGNVSDAVALLDSTLNDAEAVACMIDHFRTLVFPKPQGGIVKVTYPIVFSTEE